MFLFQAVLLCLLMVCVFVGVLHCGGPGVRKLERNDPKKITFRLVAVFIGTVLCLLITSTASSGNSIANENESKDGGIVNFLDRVGMQWECGVTFLGILHVAILFAPAITYSWRHIVLSHGRYCIVMAREYITEIVSDRIARLSMIRDALVAPVAEEVVFRGCIVSLLFEHASGWDHKWIVLIAGIVFGSAHLHSAVDLVVGENYGWGEAAWSALGHFAFTSLFGIYAASVFASTRSVVVTISIHAFCNMVGLPDFDGMFSGSHRKHWMIANSISLLLFLTTWSFFWPVNTHFMSTSHPIE
jgi:hypothetical protein